MTKNAPVFAFRPARQQTRSYAIITLAAVLPVAVFWTEGLLSAVGSLFASAMLAVVALRDLGRGSDRSPRLIVDGQGLYAPGFFERKIPWSSITSISVHEGPRYGDTLEFDVRDGAEFRPVASSSKRGTFDHPGSARQKMAIRELDATAKQIREALAGVGFGRML